jgi:hypothetical protein
MVSTTDEKMPLKGSRQNENPKPYQLPKARGATLA